MAIALAPFISELRAFFPMAGLHVISVGSGGGQLLEVYRDAAHIHAVDTDPVALARLNETAQAAGMDAHLDLHPQDVCTWHGTGDVVVFEFSLHEMEDPARALGHARTLAPKVVIFDHAPDSPWAFSVVEEEKVARSTAAVKHLQPLRFQILEAIQHFPDHAALVAKVAPQGPVALERAEPHRASRDILIPMRYVCALLQRP